MRETNQSCPWSVERIEFARLSDDIMETDERLLFLEWVMVRANFFIDPDEENDDAGDDDDKLAINIKEDGASFAEDGNDPNMDGRSMSSTTDDEVEGRVWFSWSARNFALCSFSRWIACSASSSSFCFVSSSINWVSSVTIASGPMTGCLGTRKVEETKPRKGEKARMEGWMEEEEEERKTKREREREREKRREGKKRREKKNNHSSWELNKGKWQRERWKNKMGMKRTSATKKKEKPKERKEKRGRGEEGSGQSLCAD